MDSFVGYQAFIQTRITASMKHGLIGPLSQILAPVGQVLATLFLHSPFLFSICSLLLRVLETILSSYGNLPGNVAGSVIYCLHIIFCRNLGQQLLTDNVWWSTFDDLCYE